MPRSIPEMFARWTAGPTWTWAIYLAAASALSLLPGCTVGPDYRGPPEVAPHAQSESTFHRAEPQETTDAPPARWWAALNDPALTELIELGLRNSPTLQAAEARIREARALLLSQRAGEFPSATSTAAAIRASVPPNSPLSALTGGSSAGGAGAAASPPARQAESFYTAGFDATWEIDLFGGVRRGVESARARVSAETARYEDAQVQLAAEIGQVYATLRSQQLQLSLAQSDVAAQTNLVELTLLRSHYGTADASNIEPARTQLIQSRATTAPLPGQLAQTLDQLALLTGQEPGALDVLSIAPARLPTLPQAVAIGDPAAMLRRRPDVRAAERTLAASNAAIGSAVAKRFPSITLFGNVGFTNGQFPNLFRLDSLSALGGPILRWNFLDFGAVQAGVNQARAADDEALANYRSAVLSALQDAESSLSRFGQQRLTLEQRVAGVAAADRTLQIARVREAGGTASTLDVVRAESQKVQSEQSRVSAEAELLRDFMALQKSLGLGWQPVEGREPG